MVSTPSLRKEISDKRASSVSQILKYLHEQPQMEAYQLEDFSFSVANDANQMKECFSLAYQEYLKKGYVTSQDSSPMIVSEYDMDKKTMVVMAKNKFQKVIGTLTIVVDDKKGLPCDELFSDELKSLRQEGSKVAEVVRLAISEDYQNSKEILIGMFNLVCNYVKNVANCSDLVIEVNPRHVKYYQRLLLFKGISGVKECQRVEGAPAVLLCLNKSDVLAYRKNGQEKEYLRSLHPYLSSGAEELQLAKMIQTKMTKITAETIHQVSVYFQEHCLLELTR